MGIDSDGIGTVTFDSYSTLVNPRSAGRVLEGYVAEPWSVAERWHSLAVQFATVANHLDIDRTYYQLHRDAIAYLLSARDVNVSESTLNELTDVYYDLEPFDDVRPGMEALSDAGYRLAVLSNGNPELLETLVEVTGTGDLIEATISAEEIGRFKPAVELYEHAADRLDTPVGEILHVGAGWGDVMGCMHAGMQGVWLNRRDEPWPGFDGDPCTVARSMADIVAFLTDGETI